MKTRKIYYKAILRDTRQSVVVDQPNIIVRYLANEWVYPKVPNSKLMVFENLDDAKIFSGRTNRDCMIVKCHVKKPIKAKSKRNKYPIISWYENHYYGDTVKLFWEEIQNKDIRKEFISYTNYTALSVCKKRSSKWSKILFTVPPFGTILCDAVYCLE